MKHAGTQAIAQVSGLIDQIARHRDLVPKKPGIFYRKGRAFLHFHEDVADLFCDVRLKGTAFERFHVSQFPSRLLCSNNWRKRLADHRCLEITPKIQALMQVCSERDLGCPRKPLRELPLLQVAILSG